MTHRTLLSITLTTATALALPACLYKGPFRDGAKCSDDNTCPPNQRCSRDGECLAPCPVPDCVGDTCGCDHAEVDDHGRDRICLEDGLCHRTCATLDDYCPGQCDVATGICRPACVNDWCANDAGCLEVSTAPTVRICVGAWGDGGVGPDAAPCTDCGGGCVDLQTSSEHCGICDHACAGGECLGGQCQPLAIGALPTRSLLSVAQDPANLYFANWNGEVGSIHRCGKAGCVDPPELVADAAQAGAPIAVAASGWQVYWVDSGDRLLRCSNLGCTGFPDVLLDGRQLRSLAANDTHVYFYDASGTAGVRRCAVPDCAGGPEEVWPLASGGPLLLDDTSVYFVERGPGTPRTDRLLACDLGGCGAEPRQVASENFIEEIAQDAAQIYLHLYDTDTDEHQVRWCLKTGGASTLIQSFQDAGSGSLSPAASDLGVFWRSPAGLDGWWGGCPDCPRTFTSLIPYALLADAFYVFFVDESGGIFRLVPR